jgi:hypothetical protein
MEKINNSEFLINVLINTLKFQFKLLFFFQKGIYIFLKLINNVIVFVWLIFVLFTFFILIVLFIFVYYILDYFRLNIMKFIRRRNKDFCCICQQPKKHSEILFRPNVCFHYFHYECIKNWEKCKKTCPLCRKNFKKII